MHSELKWENEEHVGPYVKGALKISRLILDCFSCLPNIKSIEIINFQIISANSINFVSNYEMVDVDIYDSKFVHPNISYL